MSAAALPDSRDRRPDGAVAAVAPEPDQQPVMEPHAGSDSASAHDCVDRVVDDDGRKADAVDKPDEHSSPTLEPETNAATERCNKTDCPAGPDEAKDKGQDGRHAPETASETADETTGETRPGSGNVTPTQPGPAPAGLTTPSAALAVASTPTTTQTPTVGTPKPGEPAPEIDTIMSQFSGSGGGPGEDEIMSPRMELANSIGAASLLGRRQSLASGIPAEAGIAAVLTGSGSTPVAATATASSSATETATPQKPGVMMPPKRTSSLPSAERERMVAKPSQPADERGAKPATGSEKTLLQVDSQTAVPTPTPTPTSASTFTSSGDPPVFDFQVFRQQLQQRSADPVAKYLRSFLHEFEKKQWMVHQQVKIVSDFLDFISKKMALCDVWADMAEPEFENAVEGMEKLVMNRLHDKTFSPMIPSLEEATAAKRFGQSLSPYRRGQHQEDVERDGVLAQKVRIYGWVREPHLDLKPVQTDKNQKLFGMAQKELRQTDKFRAPRDKVICILNCCKVIFELLRRTQADQSADAFIPMLIFIILQTNPPNLVSNVQYILRFRNQDKLAGEASYYISSLMGAIQFIEGLDRTRLTISDDEFERQVEQSVSAIAERHQAGDDADGADEGGVATAMATPTPTPTTATTTATTDTATTPTHTSVGGSRSGTPRDKLPVGSRPDLLTEEIPAVAAGIFQTIQQPLSTIRKMFMDESGTSETETARLRSLSLSPSSVGGSIPAGLSRGPTPESGRPHRLPHHRLSGASALAAMPIRSSSRADPDAAIMSSSQVSSPVPPSGMFASSPGPESPSPAGTDGFPPGAELDVDTTTSTAGLADADEERARIASAEAAQAQRIQARELAVVTDTLAGMFPALDRDVIEDVVREKQGRIGAAVDVCITLSNE